MGKGCGTHIALWMVRNIKDRDDEEAERSDGIFFPRGAEPLSPGGSEHPPRSSQGDTHIRLSCPLSQTWTSGSSEQITDRIFHICVKQIFSRAALFSYLDGQPAWAGGDLHWRPPQVKVESRPFPLPPVPRERELRLHNRHVCLSRRGRV